MSPRRPSRSSWRSLLALRPRPARRPRPSPAGGIQFADGTAHAGIAFRHNSGAFGKKYLPETMGSGLALFDFDNDGWLDVFFANETAWPGQPGPPTSSALYRNDRDGTFTDVTKAAGLAVPMFAIGAAAADYDNDGWKDLYVTAIGGNHLFRNLGNGTFADVTAKTGTKGPGTFGTSAMFFDYDRDGHLDLVVANYVTWTVDKDLFCTLDGKTKSYCTPESYKGESPTLFRNRGDGTFEDATPKAGLWDPTSKALGVALHRPRRGRLARLRPRQRHPAQQALPQQPGRHLHRRGHDGRDRVRRDRGGPRRHGRRRRRLLGRRAAPSLLIAQLLERDDRPLPQRGQRPLRRRGPGLHRGPGEHADPRLRHLLLRLRPRRPARHLRRQRPRGRRHRRGAAAASPTRSRRTSSATWATAASSRWRDSSAPPCRSRSWRAAPPTATSTTTATSTCWSARTTARPSLFRNDGGNRNRFLRVKTIGTKSNRDGIGAKVTVTLADRSRAVAARAHRLVLLLAERHRASPSASAPVSGSSRSRSPGRAARWTARGPVVANQVAFVAGGPRARLREGPPREGERPARLESGPRPG